MSGAVSTLARLAEDYPVTRPALPIRTRVESTPLLFSNEIADPTRRKSEDWSSRSWRMGEGPGAAETLGEFGDGVKKKESGELLAASTTAAAASVLKKPVGRHRGGSLGRDSRLYGDAPKTSMSDEDDGKWGTEVEGVRIGECSAMTGEGGCSRAVSASGD